MFRTFPVALALFLAASCGRQPARISDRPAPKTAPNAVLLPSVAHPDIVVSDTLASAKMIRSVRPHYPAWARRKHVQGNVEFLATIGKDGTLHNVTFLRGPQELVPYAEKAVRQWRYKPTRLNGDLVEVKTTILVPFTLNQ